MSVNRDKSLRLILDLSVINQFVFKNHIKFDDWQVMEEYVQQNDYLYKFDISKGYHHVGIWAGHQKYLGFSRILQGRQRYFKFSVLPFGITSGPFIFMKVMRVLI